MPKGVKRGQPILYDTDNYYLLKEAADVYRGIKGDIQKQFNTSNCDERRRKRSLPLQKKKKEVIGLTKDKKAAKIITKFAAPVAKSFSYCVQKDDHEIDDSEFISAR